MKRGIILSILIASVTMTGCYYYGPCIDGTGPVVKDIRELSDFTAVSNRGSFEVNVSVADSFYVEVEAQQNLLSIIETNVSGNTLIIRRQAGTCFRNGDMVVVNVSLPRLEALELEGSGQVIGDVGESHEFECSNTGSGYLSIDTIYADLISIRNSGSGTVNIGGSYTDEISMKNTGSGILDAGTVYDASDVEIQHNSSGRVRAIVLNGHRIDASLSGSGRIDLEGDVSDAEFTLNASGRIDALDLEAIDVIATTTGSGKIYVWATETLDATITGSGDIIYRGDPDISFRITGSGSVRPY